ncbi:hypothetical protein [Aeromonas hydrophila]|uniref:hypothetical protein n=1 Tax=Aeromonas hydrophila TaxID=644 RepID=UPI001A90AFFF|nr:hypothetical protein [Aeromonas hydrophila]MBQ4666506.1 hypothetical protein [Aeromonas hydrophila]MBQ4715131.1 hypothetical protein [Aeromonas hydrophila]MBW3823547.1 hypothetical protein [Aeromonas hydrophila]MBW5268222.1 hypothetical protein [Aeromonas hydrophila]QSR51574.1 hypothetical protein GO458_09595 [Aeromonas hydrophila]
MQIDDKVKAALESIQSGKLDGYLQQIDNSDFGLYVPVYEDQGMIKLMLEGYSQTERNLVISVGKKEEDDPQEALPVGWLGQFNAKDSSCNHPKENKCRHCTSHQSKCRHCTHTKSHTMGDINGAPELDYHETVKQITDKQDLLQSLAVDGIGLTLLHGHSDQFMFTKLPEGYVSVIVNGVTTFRKESDVAADSTFVPNVWRSINGELRVAGGHSQITEADF